MMTGELQSSVREFIKDYIAKSKTKINEENIHPKDLAFLTGKTDPVLKHLAIEEKIITQMLAQKEKINFFLEQLFVAVVVKEDLWMMDDALEKELTAFIAKEAMDQIKDAMEDSFIAFLNTFETK